MDDSGNGDEVGLKVGTVTNFNCESGWVFCLGSHDSAIAVELLCRLFTELVRLEQSKVTLICVLDSVNVYDDPEFMQELEVERVLYEVLSLTRDAEVQTNVKILLTSPSHTATIWKPEKNHQHRL